MSRLKELRKFGKQVRRYRRAMDMPQIELADLVGCGRTTIYRIEHGQSFPDIVLAIEIAQALGVSLDILAELNEVA